MSTVSVTPSGNSRLCVSSARLRLNCVICRVRIFQLLAELDFLFVKANEVVAARILNRRMKRREGLHHDFALHVATARATGDLREQLKGALARAEVRDVQREVRVNDPDERD